MFPTLDIPFEYWIEPVTFGLLCVMFRFSTRIFYRWVPRFATDCRCDVWYCGLTTCLLYVPFEYWIESVTFELLCVMFRFSTMIFYRWVPCFATDCPCGVWYCGLTICLLYVACGYVSLTQWRTTFPLSLIMFYIYRNASQYDNTWFSFILYPCLK